MRNRKGQLKKKRQRHWLCHDSLLSHGGEDVCSHAPVVRLKNPGLLHSLEQCRSTHGCLVGKELVIPLLLHLLAPLLSTSLLLTPQASAFCLLQQGNKQRLFYFSCKDTGEDKQHSQQPRWCLRQAKAS